MQLFNTGGTASLLLVVGIMVLDRPNQVQTIDTWWNLGPQGLDVEPESIEAIVQPACSRLAGLSPGQMKFCQMYPSHIAIVSRGAQLGITECQSQFKSRRWNCTTVNDSSVFGPVVQSATREAAFTHAIMAAAVVHAVSRACKDGELTKCGCSARARPKAIHQDWLWGGCGDNTDYGYRFGAAFVDMREKEKNYPRHSKGLARMLMNLHNNEAGRRAVYKYVKVGCKCHGVSGSCSLRTCWNQLPPFRETGERLRDRYDGASEVKFNSQGTRLIQTNKQFNKPTKDDLLYIEQSADFCEADPSVGSHGTRGRPCDRQSPGIDGCNLMCCGRGYKTYRTKVSERCNCRFQWCCSVKCQTCERITEVYTCK